MTLTRRAAAIELAILLTLVFSFIWTWAGTFPGSRVVIYVLGLGFTVATHLIHREGPAELGLRLDNLVAAARDAAIPTLPIVGFFLAMGYAKGHWHPEALDAERFLKVTAWGFMQQYLLQSFMHRRLQLLIRRPHLRDAAVGAIFALLHLPNPVLVPVTFIAGTIFAILFRRHPNLLILALCHALGSTAVAFGFDPDILHRMRVGPGYWRV